MSLDKRHFMPKKADRDFSYFHPIYKMASASKKEYDRVENLLDEATVDFINGKSKSDILLKLEAGLYPSQNKGINHNQAIQYFQAILSRLKIDEPDQDAAKSVFYSMYLNLYNEAMNSGNNMHAKQVLDSMVKLMGLDKPANQTNIQVNSDKENGITINFGYSSESE